MKRGIFINAKDKTVTEVFINDKENNVLHELYKLIGCELVEVVSLSESEDLWVDEEGLLGDPKHFFNYNGYGLLAGNGVILGIDDETGKTKSTTLSVDEVKEKVLFFHVNVVSPAE